MACIASIKVTTLGCSVDAATGEPTAAGGPAAGDGGTGVVWEQIWSGKSGFSFPESGVPVQWTSSTGKLPVRHLIYFLKCYYYLMYSRLIVNM